ncbi:uncharacterized protein EV420DRAFT_543832 [Desarmillaria tabescens]|uniref:Uncharacterized protein n=1 Tax=Armillaria tabescens TaxID=1929756 RepID=A0AA39N4P7_ARMTA|nr:uncharacterized protein EV420DRAFT_543832 [Desarmillaria tabescens]KAK0457175.1 hypothetical protein EV420DRAFT_543832 [Desarmillaria tabescens]
MLVESDFDPTTMNDPFAHVIYTKEFIHKCRGYPFWHPEPDSFAPDEFQIRGILPGDVGIINKDGGFDFLFSIFGNADGLVVGNAPPGLQPLPTPDQPEVQAYPELWNVLKSQHVSCRYVSDVPAESFPGIVDTGVAFDVSTSEDLTAILHLPNYSTRYETMNEAFFQNYARQYGVSWYNHANGTLGRNVRNGFLYLVTGCDKTATWGNAVIRKTDWSFTFYLKCTLENVDGETVKVANEWIDDAGVEDGLFPNPYATYPYPIGLQNQCIFAQGFTISLSAKLFCKTWLAVPHFIKGSPEDRLPSFDSNKVPHPPSDGKTRFSTYLSSFIGSKTVPNNSDSDQRRMMAENADSHGSFIAEVPEFPPLGNQVLNPSTVMNEYLLSKDPSLEIAVTHDKEWMDVMKKYEKDTYLTEEELWCKLKDSLDAKLSSNVYQIPLHLYNGSRLWAIDAYSTSATFRSYLHTFS